MCSVRDMRASLHEVRRVLRPGGRFLFIEHVAAPRGSALRAMQVRPSFCYRHCPHAVPSIRPFAYTAHASSHAQTVLDPAQQAFFCGCHLARDPMAALSAAGFARVDAARFSLGDAPALAAAARARGGAAATVAALRAASADAGAGWQPRLGGPPAPPHFLLSPHIAGVATV